MALFVALLAGVAPRAGADELRVAVASNFVTTARVVADLFETASGHEVVLVSGSTGKHYAQIRNGARLDAFLAADRRRPELLEAEGLAVAGSRFTYALGRLVLWSAEDGLADRGPAVLAAGDFRHLAVAEPRLAPYGRAAREVLEHEGLWDLLRPLLVRGENVTQAFQFVASGNADLGFVAYSQVLALDTGAGSYRGAGSYWLVPQELHAPIEQQAILLRDLPAPRAFLDFLRSSETRSVLESRGYVVP